MLIQRKNLVLSIIFTAILFALYIPIIPEWLDDIISNENNQHCMLIPFISLYIIFTKKNVLKEKLLKASDPKGSLILFILGLIIYFTGVVGGIIFFYQISLIFLLGGAVLYIFGKDVFKELVFPLAYLIFIIPIPEAVYQALSSPMKLFASKASAELIRFTGIPVYREGVNLFFPYTSLEVVDACSGMRSLITLLAISTAFAYFFQQSFIKRAVLILASFPIALFSNIIRIFFTGIIAHVLGPKYAHGIFHTILGTLVVITIGFSLILFTNFILNHIRRRGIPRAV
ncbi:exosortase/archaeosortase family protein [Candidatus Auribacterota bacterium]